MHRRIVGRKQIVNSAWISEGLPTGLAINSGFLTLDDIECGLNRMVQICTGSTYNYNYCTDYLGAEDTKSAPFRSHQGAK